MKNTFIAIIITIFTLAGCTDKPSSTHQTVQNPSQYYCYNPDDTIDNPYFFNLLKIDTGRIYYKYRLDVIDSIMDRPVEVKMLDDSLYIETSKLWFSVLDLAAQKKWEECYRLYVDNHFHMYIALVSSRVLFDADYQVFSLLTYDYYPESEANHINIRLFDDDEFLTTSAMAFNEDYYPEHLERLTWILSALYAKEGIRDKALEYLDLYKETQMHFQEPIKARRDYTIHSMNIYNILGESDNVLKSLYDFRNYVIKNIEDEEEKSFYLYHTDEAIKDVKSKRKK